MPWLEYSTRFLCTPRRPDQSTRAIKYFINTMNVFALQQLIITIP